MKAVWDTVLKLAVKAAVYAADHPDQVIALVQAAKK